MNNSRIFCWLAAFVRGDNEVCSNNGCVSFSVGPEPVVHGCVIIVQITLERTIIILQMVYALIRQEDAGKLWQVIHIPVVRLRYLENKKN